jgi:hypothetical protein
MYNAHKSWYSYFSDSIYYQFTDRLKLFMRGKLLGSGIFECQYEKFRLVVQLIPPIGKVFVSVDG